MAILQLENQQSNELLLVKDQWRTTYESLKFSNIIKSTFKGAISGPGIKSTLMNTAIGLTSGLVTKKLLIGKTINPFKKLLGIAVEMFVANKVVTNADGIKSIGSTILNRFYKKKADVQKG